MTVPNSENTSTASDQAVCIHFKYIHFITLRHPQSDKLYIGGGNIDVWSFEELRDVRISSMHLLQHELVSV